MHKNQKEREQKLNDIYAYITNCLLSIRQLFDRTMIPDLQRQIDENNIDIILLKIK